MNHVNFENVLPGEIEKRSMEIIENELEKRGKILDDPMKAPIIKRAIHTSADFDYYDNLKFSEGSIEKISEALRKGALIITDTTMAKAGISKIALKKLGCRLECFIGDKDVSELALEKGITRSAAAVEKAATICENAIFVVGNAPTALAKIYELVKEKKLSPLAVIGVPVGFVNVIEAKELIMDMDIPYVVAVGRKGGSNVAAAIVNAFLYMTIENAERICE